MAGHDLRNAIALVATALFAVTIAFFADRHPEGSAVG